MFVNEDILKSLWDIFNKKRLIEFKLIKQLMPSYKSTEMYVIDILGEQGDKNIKSIARLLYLTDGAVSKLAKRMASRGIVRCYNRPGNNKDVYLALTEDGKSDFERHCKMKRALNDDLKIVMTDDERYETNKVLKMLQDYNAKLNRQMEKFEVGL